MERVGYLFQNYALSNHDSGREYYGRTFGKPQQKRERAAEFIEKFHLKGLEKRLPGELREDSSENRSGKNDDMPTADDSSGRALFCSGRVFAGSIAKGNAGIFEGISGTVLLVSHNRDEIYRMSEEMLVMDRGRIVGRERQRLCFKILRPK